LDQILSDYRPESELMALSRSSGGPPRVLSDDLFRVLCRAREFAERTDGAFDPTVGPVIRLWRRARRERELPKVEQLSEALGRVGYAKLELDSAARTARLTMPRMQLDLGGIAKGFAADEAMAVLRQHGVPSALIAAAGDIVAGGAPPDQAGWRVGIAPWGADRPPEEFITLRDAAVSTSGDAEQFVDLGGTRYSHIIDPRTGKALTGRVAVTVIARDATTTDALATALCVLGAERGLPLADETPGAAARFMRQTERGIEQRQSMRFPVLSDRANADAVRHTPVTFR
jgi:thiamine biosynthesis lipoprotein